MLYAQKVRYTAQTVRMMSEPTCDPTVSVSSPSGGGGGSRLRRRP